MDYSSIIKNKRSFAISTTWIDLEGIRLSEVNQTENDKYCLISFLCGIKKKKKDHRYLERTGWVVARDGK